MGRINYARVLLGGLLAGVVINISELLLNGVVLVDEYRTIMDMYGLEAPGWATVGYILAAFLLGLVVAWVYAAIRPRFGPGWKTAATAGAVIWVPAYVGPAVWFGAMGLSYGSSGVTILTLVWGLVEYVLAGMAGGWLYQENGAAAAAPAEPSGPGGPGSPGGLGSPDM